MDFEFKSSDGREEIVKSKYYKAIFIGFLVLLLNAGYLAATSSSSLFHYFNILLHIGLGMALVIPLLTKVRYYIKTDMLLGKTFGETAGRLGYFLMKVAFILGFYLLVAGNIRAERTALYLHAFTGFFAAMCLISSLRRAAYNISVENTYWLAGRWGLTVFIIAGIVPIFSIMIRTTYQDKTDFIVNEGLDPGTLAQASGQGVTSPFYPSLAETGSKGLIETDFLRQSQSCARAGCHVDLVQQFTAFGHARPAFATPWYQETYSYVQKEAGEDAGKFCAACHTPALLFEGRAANTAGALQKMPSSYTAFSCNACHAIQSVKNTLGNGAYTITRPALSDLSTSQNGILNKLHDFLIYADAAQHRGFLLKPFLREQSSEFCSTCHKLTLENPITKDQPVPGLTEYDYWAGSSFANSDIKAFDKIRNLRECTDCHLPLIAANDPARIDGQVHDHSFQHPQLARLESSRQKTGKDSLRNVEQDFRLQVEIFAAKRIAGHRQRSLGKKKNQVFSAQFAINNGQTVLTENHRPPRTHAVLAPLKNQTMSFEPGESLRVDVLVKPRNMGHAFPAGSPGAAEAWLEFQVKDNTGRLIYHTGKNVDTHDSRDETRLFGIRFVDEKGKPVNFAHGIGAKAVSHFNLLPPGAIDLSSYVFHLPEDCGPEIQISAKLHYRKIGLESTAQMANVSAETNGSSYLSNQAQEGDAPDFQNEKLSSTTRLHGAAMVTLSADTVKLSRNSSTDKEAHPEYHEKNLHLAWNDYGIGLLRRNRRHEALGAFQKAISLQPDFSDGYINIARTYLLSGHPDLAIQNIARVDKTDGENPRGKYFLALALKATGKLVEAKAHLNKLRKVYPEDRAIMNELGHIYYLLESYKAAHRIFRAVTRFAPDDPVAHFFLSHVYRKLKKPQKAAYEEKLYARFSKRMNNYIVKPSLAVEKSFQDWQVLPWANYDRYSFRKN